MGKSKKGKKHDEVQEASDSETEQQAAKETPDEELNKKAGKKPKKIKSKKVEGSDSEADELPVKKALDKPKAESKQKVREQNSDDDQQLSSQQYSAFALLQDGDSDDDEVVKEDKPAKQPKKQKKKPEKKEQDDGEDATATATGGKKEKKKKKKRGDSEEDWDAIMAELQLEDGGVNKPEESKTKVKAAETMKKDEKKAREPAAAEPVIEQSSSKKKNKQNKKAAEEEKPTPIPEIIADTALASTEAPSDKPSEVEEPAAGAKKKKGPGKAMVAAMQEALKKKKEDEERREIEEEERNRLLEEVEQERLDKVRLEIEKKEKKKQKEKERKERLRAEGKLLTPKQRADRARAEAMIEGLKAQGASVPEAGEKKMRPGTRIRPSKQKKDEEAAQPEPLPVEQSPVKEAAVLESEKEVPKLTEAPEVEEPIPEPEEIKAAWDASSGEEEEENDEDETPPESEKKPSEASKKRDSGNEESESEDESSDEESSNESSEGSSSEESDHRTDAEKMRERAEMRIRKREAEAETKRTIENLRAAVVCVLGHVDTGKTKILDKLRRTNVQDGEAGGITQQIGATNVPIENIKDNTKHLRNYAEMIFKIPGLLIIDTPGHESFSNMRSRGSSLCDIAILVVDIMHGLEPQTIESLELLKARKTPFVVALNKIDRLYDWNAMPRKDIRDIIKAQAVNTQQEFDKRTKETIVQFAEQGMNAALFYDNPDPRTYISMVPTSAITGEGMGNLLMLVVQFSQNQLAKRLMYSETMQATVLEVKAIPGLGTTIDAILINGKLREGDTMILAGTDGPIVTQVKALLMPQPMKELRVKNAYVEHKEIMAAQGVKIAAKELEKAIAGINLQIAQKPDEVEIYKDIVKADLRSVLRGIKLSDKGVFVQASTLGSLEALLEFLKTSKIPYAGIRIGPVVRKDVMKASIMLEHQSEYATILAFDVKIERDAQEMADHVGVKIFQADIIYHLFDKFTAYREELKQKNRDQFKSIAVFPCKLKILPQHIFNSRDPIVMGVIVEAGIVKEGTPICVPSKGFEELGMVTSVQVAHKDIHEARKGMEVCIKIDAIPGDAPKMFGRHFDATDTLVSKISRQSIDACKDYFRDDLLKSDWALMVELKKLFEIL